MDETGRLFAAALASAQWDAALAELEADRPYARPGDPRGLFLTASEWADYDEHQALCDRMEAKYGRLLPEAFPALGAQMRVIR